MARWQQQRGRGLARAAALTTVAGVLALAGAAPGAMGDCLAVVNITSYYARTVMGVVRRCRPFGMDFVLVSFSAFPLCAGELDAGPALESPTVNATGIGRCRRPTDSPSAM